MSCYTSFDRFLELQKDIVGISGWAGSNINISHVSLDPVAADVALTQHILSDIVGTTETLRGSKYIRQMFAYSI